MKGKWVNATICGEPTMVPQDLVPWIDAISEREDLLRKVRDDPSDDKLMHRYLEAVKAADRLRDSVRATVDPRKTPASAGGKENNARPH